MNERKAIGRGRWEAPPELRYSPPRLVRLSPAGKAVAVVAVTLAGGGLFLGVCLGAFSARDAERTRAFEREGVRATAEVFEIRRVRGENPRRIASYRYLAIDAEYRGQVRLRRADWSRVEEGGTIQVRYLPSEPGRSAMVGYEPKGIPPWVGPVVGVILMALGVALFAYLRSQRTLLSEGRVAMAEVSDSTKFRRSTGHGHHAGFRVRYDFQITSGAKRSGSYEVEKNPPSAGSILTVVYDRDDPKRCARYPLSLVRVVR